ncbi:MAG: hypothetical protein H6Q17_1796 [Bacteroidetes bacterium]|nr:hypothetical protein [Bacteroidota bacterium]
MKRYKYFFLVAAIVLTACAGSKISVEKPAESYIAPSIEKKISTIDIALDINVEDIEKSINNRFKDIIYNDTSLVDDNLKLKVWKQQDLRFSLNGSHIDCIMPLKIWLETGFRKKILGATFQQNYEANGAITLDVSIDYHIQKDWSVITSTKINDYTWTQKPTVKVAGTEMPITFISNIILKSLQKKIDKSIDEAIEKNMNIRQAMTKTWSIAQKPIQINKEYNVWLKVTPKSILSTPMVSAGNHINFNLGINALIETSVGNPINGNNQIILPDYQYVSEIKPDFNILFSVNLDYKKLTEISSKQIIGKTFRQGNKHITIDKIKFYGHNGLLVVETKLSGSANGTIYCVGKPVFNNANQTLSITNFDFDMKTKNVLVKSANWLMHNKFLKMVEPNLTISMKDQIGDIVNSSNAMLANYELIKGISLNGQLEKNSFDAITITPTAIVISGQLSGNLNLKVNQVQF